MVYDTINITQTANVTTLPDFMININNGVGGWYSIALLIMLWAIVFISLKKIGTFTEDALAIACFFEVVVCIFFFAMDFSGSKELIFSILLTGIAVFWLYIDKQMGG
jgi:hypothetical protein